MTSFGSELILARLQQLHPKRIDLSLGRIERLLEALGRPERRLPPVVHIAGTNGKGSTLAMLDAMLAAAGWRVDRYISPHLVRFNERILRQGRPIADELLVELLDRCEQANAGAPITFFEVTTAAAFLAFAADPADLLLLETGLGGRLDATNVVDRPCLTLLSPISMDHESFLGDRLEAIAGEKAGILKPGVPCVSGPQEPPAAAVIATRAAALGVPLIVHGRDWMARSKGDRLIIEDGQDRLDLPLPGLRGVHQIENAGLAVMAARRLGAFTPPEDSIARGLQAAVWAARLQRLTQGVLPRLLGPVHELWLDGGHNPAAGLMLARSLPELARGRPVHLIVGMLQAKDAASFLAPILPLARSFQAVLVEGESAARPAAELARIAAELGADARAAGSLEAAIEALAPRLGEPSVVLICGSLYLAGRVLREHA